MKLPALIKAGQLPAIIETPSEEKAKPPQAPSIAKEIQLPPTTIAAEKVEGILFGEEAIVHEDSADSRTLIRGSRLAVMMASRSLKTAMISHQNATEMNTLMEELELETYLDQSFSRKDLKELSPSEVYLQAAETLGVPAERCLVFEKGPHEIRAAQEAGMLVIALGEPHGSGKIESPNQRLNFIENFMDLPADFFDLLEAGRPQSGLPVIPDRIPEISDPGPSNASES